MRYVVDLQDVDERDVAMVGGKAARLGQLRRMADARVPDGFCVTVEAFDAAVTQDPVIAELLDELSGTGVEDREALRGLSARVRSRVGTLAVAGDLAAEVTRSVVALSGEQARCAVRSSATAEDLPNASFAGLHDSYLDVAGPAAVLEHLRRCWASAFSERAVVYRLRNGFDHRDVRMAVIVQRMVAAESAGVLFTADPVSSNRKVAVVEAVTGLGEALVSGAVTPDVFRVRDGEVVERALATEPPALTDAQAVALVDLGRRVEARLGGPQDIEWCLADDAFAVVQARPITTLFPIPEAGDDEPHVYVSVGHQQMMTDAMKPLGVSVWLHTTPRPMTQAGGRLFVDVGPALASPAMRAPIIAALGTSDPLIGEALQRIVDRGDLVRPLPGDEPAGGPAGGPLGGQAAPIETDPAIVTELVERTDASIAACRREIESKSGAALLDFILADFEQLRAVLLDPPLLPAITASMDAATWLDEHLEAWLGERNAAGVLTQSVAHNVTSEMGLALLDVADAIRPHPEAVAVLERVGAGGVEDERFLDELASCAGGEQVRTALDAFLDRYGMRCAGEIDITRPRWIERPTALVPTLLGNVRHFAPGEARRRFERGLEAATAKRREVLERLRALPDGERKAQEVDRMIERLRTFAGFREYPKYGMVRRYWIYKQALLAEAERLVHAGTLGSAEDIFFLTLEELADVVRTGRADRDLIARRQAAHRAHEALSPPRVLTSEGEVLTGEYRRDDVPAGALAGLAVSAGTVEGRARVVLDMAGADLEPGDILVTTATDPSWTPLFPTIAGLVTEVGGLMTHGAVIAREYGLPAVVGVQGATGLIADGRRIRVHGTDGYVELVS